MRGVNDGRITPDNAFGVGSLSAEAAIVSQVSALKTMEAAHKWDASPPKCIMGAL